MNLEEEEANTKLEATFDGTKQEVSGKERNRQGTKQWEPSIEPNKVVVQERRQRRVRVDVYDNVDEPKETDNHGKNSQQQ
jgi:hypothetical protein